MDLVGISKSMFAAEKSCRIILHDLQHNQEYACCSDPQKTLHVMLIFSWLMDATEEKYK